MSIICLSVRCLSVCYKLCPQLSQAWQNRMGWCSKSSMSKKRVTQTCTICREIWNLPHKFHLYIIIIVNTFIQINPHLVHHSVPWNRLWFQIGITNNVHYQEGSSIVINSVKYEIIEARNVVEIIHLWWTSTCQMCSGIQSIQQFTMCNYRLKYRS